MTTGGHYTITIAASVRDESAAGMRPGDPVLEYLPWMHIEEAVPHNASLPSKLDAGERATIALATAQIRPTLIFVFRRHRS